MKYKLKLSYVYTFILKLVTTLFLVNHPQSINDKHSNYIFYKDIINILLALDVLKKEKLLQ